MAYTLVPKWTLSHLLGDEVRGVLYCFGDLKALLRKGRKWKEVDELRTRQKVGVIEDYKTNVY